MTNNHPYKPTMFCVDIKEWEALQAELAQLRSRQPSDDTDTSKEYNLNALKAAVDAGGTIVDDQGYQIHKYKDEVQTDFKYTWVLLGEISQILYKSWGPLENIIHQHTGWHIKPEEPEWEPTQYNLPALKEAVDAIKSAYIKDIVDQEYMDYCKPYTKGEISYSELKTILCSPAPHETQAKIKPDSIPTESIVDTEKREVDRILSGGPIITDSSQCHILPPKEAWFGLPDDTDTSKEYGGVREESSLDGFIPPFGETHPEYELTKEQERFLKKAGMIKPEEPQSTPKEYDLPALKEAVDAIKGDKSYVPNEYIEGVERWLDTQAKLKKEKPLLTTSEILFYLWGGRQFQSEDGWIAKRDEYGVTVLSLKEGKQLYTSWAELGKFIDKREWKRI